MRNKTNIPIREECKKNGVYLWEVAELMGISPQTMSIKLRHELPADEQEWIINLIRYSAHE